MAVEPVLVGERVRLVPFAEEFLTQRYVGWLNDPVVTRYSEQGRRRHTLDSCREFWRSFDGSDDFFWAVVAGADGHVGNITAKVDRWYAVAEVSILIGETKVWGCGHGAEAFGLACRWLLEGHGMRKVFAGTLAPNAGMRAIMRKLGMIEDGVRKAHAVVDGTPVDVVYAALFAPSA